jgi:hypothetical protein
MNIGNDVGNCEIIAYDDSGNKLGSQGIKLKLPGVSEQEIMCIALLLDHIYNSGFISQPIEILVSNRKLLNVLNLRIKPSYEQYWFLVQMGYWLDKVQEYCKVTFAYGKGND